MISTIGPVHSAENLARDCRRLQKDWWEFGPTKRRNQIDQRTSIDGSTANRTDVVREVFEWVWLKDTSTSNFRKISVDYFTDVNSYTSLIESYSDKNEYVSQSVTITKYSGVGRINGFEDSFYFHKLATT